MKYSIIIPLYNKQHTIRRAIYSALDQEGFNNQNIEIIVIDDGSSDQSVEHVKAIQRATPNRAITLYQQPNQGVSAARNQGVSLATHDLVTFLDADDAYKPTFISIIDNLVNKRTECGAFATAYEFISSHSGTKKTARLYGINRQEQSQVLDDFFISAALGDLPFCSSSICIRKDVFKKLGGFPEGHNMGEDQALFSQLALRHKIAYSPESCASYYLDVPHSLMQSEPVIAEMPFSKALQHALDQNAVPVRLISSIKHYIAGHLLDLVRRNLTNGNVKAVKHLLKDDRSKTHRLKWHYWNFRYSLSAKHQQAIIDKP